MGRTTITNVYQPKTQKKGDHYWYNFIGRSVGGGIEWKQQFWIDISSPMPKPILGGATLRMSKTLQSVFIDISSTESLHNKLLLHVCFYMWNLIWIVVLFCCLIAVVRRNKCMKITFTLSFPPFFSFHPSLLPTLTRTYAHTQSHPHTHTRTHTQKKNKIKGMGEFSIFIV